MGYLDKLFGSNKEDNKLLVCDSENLEKEVSNWLLHAGKESFSDILLEIGFNEGDIVYLYDNGCRDLEFYYSLNVNDKKQEHRIRFGYGGFRGKGAQITIINNNKSITYKRNECNVFKLESEQIKVSDLISYNRFYLLSGSWLTINFNVENNDYILILNSIRNIKDEDMFRLDNENELEKYLSNLKLPTFILDIFMNICEICNIDLSLYSSFDLELCRRNKKIFNVTEGVSHVKYMNGKFCLLSYIKDGKKININSSGDWSYEMINEDDLVTLSIEVKNDKVDCKINSNNEVELDDYFKYLLLYDMNIAKNEVNEMKKLVRSITNK